MTTGMTPEADAALRAHVRALLTLPQAHLTLDAVLNDFPEEHRHTRVQGVPSSAWELLWHLRFTQRDILNFVRDGAYAEPRWPADYWPAEDAAQDWEAEVHAFWHDFGEVLALLDDPAVDLLAVVPNGTGEGGGGQTWLRGFLLLADHNAYHVGQLALRRKMLGGA
ncbi:DinB family protein [Deinococcus hopiensis]|uniref:DinB superfamily protein n=1 Tax=Deinococcus hopiensis KR-140 TaxID=695939 RepID=A0A1W1VCW6_9DEIO|nr:DinB family protein [Deinococcus hopiensis]SMB91287.1 DinB superfamily protein [Deinococcus hopiensis KR-140]